MFFLMNKPIIYCPSQIELNKEYQYILRGMYLATSWNEIEKIIKRLVNGNDEKKSCGGNVLQNSARNILVQQNELWIRLSKTIMELNNKSI